MDQQKIGKFIANERKEKGLTQAALAEKLGITDRAVSKWETGKSLPDASLMLELSEILGISVNELLTGERIKVDDYKKIAEENLLEMKKKEEINNKKLLHFYIIINILGFLSLGAFIGIAVLADISWLLRSIIIGLAIMVFGITTACSFKIDHDAGYYMCPNCDHRYVPSMALITFAPHMGFTKYMKCPKCKKKGWHKKVLSK
ncbi:MAG: helix-turn-helix domain-containing protein [Eubacterium sp.]|nr:helix-turn-helix domain-containing protein [Eubacterium sp.]